MKSLYIISFFSYIVFTVLCSCNKDFLEVPDKTVLLRQAYVVDLKTTEDFLNGIYVELASHVYDGPSVIYPDVIADNIKPIVGASLFSSHYGWAQHTDEDGPTQLNPSSQNANGIWFAGYRIIREASFVIDKIDDYKTENPEKADDIKGQAYGLRALAHYLLINVFAQPYGYTPDGSHEGIPYVRTSDWTQAVSRQSVAEVYSGMAEDLQKAMQLLSKNTTTNVLKFNSNAAKSLLARISLFRGDYNSAKNLAREIGIDVPIMPTPDYPGKLFTQQETEALFQLPPSAQGAAGGAGSYSVYYAGVYFAQPVLYLTATNDIAAILNEDPRDARSKWVTNDGTNWNITKYPTDVVPGFPLATMSYYQTILRSSEMYLTAAEAYARLNDEDSARFFLDAIRKRANSSISSISASGNALLDSIYKERRKELAFEGLRMFDLLRTKRGVFRADVTAPATNQLSYPNNKAIAPIPLQDVMLGGLKQNSGY